MTDADTGHAPIETPPTDVAGLRAALAEARDATTSAVAPVAAQSVDAGWKSRALIFGTIVGVLVIFIASFLELVAITGWWQAALSNEAAALLVRFDAKIWLYGVIAGMCLIAVALGFIRFDKLIDLARDALPILRAKYGIKEPPG